MRSAPSPAAAESTVCGLQPTSSPMCGAGRQPRSSPHIGDHGQLHSTSSRSKYRCALALKPTPSMRYRRPRTDMAAAWHACACSSAGEVAAAAAADTATIIAAVAIAAVAAAVTVAAVAAATAASACGKVQLCRAQAARAARRGGARAGSSGGARERFTRRCARGSACARRVTCAAARRFAAGRGPWLVLTLSAFARPHAQVRERHLRPRPRCHRAASQVVGAAPPVRPPSGGATGGEFGALPLDPQVRAIHPCSSGCRAARSPRALVLTQPAPTTGACGVRRLPSKRHAAADSRRSFRQRAPECGARAAPRPPNPSMLCAGVSVDLLRRVARAPSPLLCALRRVAAPRAHVSAALCSGGVTSAGAWPNAVRVRRRRHDPRCCEPARGCVASRALLSTALCAVPRWPRYALTCVFPCAQAPIVGAAVTRVQWRNHAPALPTAASACTTTCAITQCACLVARQAQRRTRHALRYDYLPFERARSRLRPPMRCCVMLIDPPTHRLAAPAASEPLITPHLPPCMSSLCRSVAPEAGGGCEGCWGGHRAAQWPHWRPDPADRLIFSVPDCRVG
jgi:hypothetical protein